MQRPGIWNLFGNHISTHRIFLSPQSIKITNYIFDFRHIACCHSSPSGFVSSDNAVYVWDIRRPYLPFAIFETHKKTCTG